MKQDGNYQKQTKNKQKITNIGENMDKQYMVYTLNGILFSLKILTLATTWMNLEDINYA